MSNPTDATEVERAPVAPSVAQPPAVERRAPAGGTVDGPVRRGTGPSTSPLLITVIGRPAPQGSKRHLGHGVMVESSKRLKPWREAVKEAALTALECGFAMEYGQGSHAHMCGPDEPRTCCRDRIMGPVAVEIVFCFDPPRSAPKKRRIWPVTRSSGDIDKLSRACLDALTDAACFKDDSQVIDLHARKVHTNDPDAPLAIPGAVIAITTIEGTL